MAALLELPPLDARHARYAMKRFRKGHDGTRMPTHVSSATLLTRRMPPNHTFASFGTVTVGGYAEKFRETHRHLGSARRAKAPRGRRMLASASSSTLGSISASGSSIAAAARPRAVSEPSSFSRSVQASALIY